VPDGAPVALGTFERLYRYYQVEPGFFDALGIDVVAGRVFTSADGPGQAPVAVVTQPGAAAWWPGESPLGRQIKIGEQGTWMTIVRVVEHVQDLDALGRTIALNGQRMPLLFVPARQLPMAPPGWGVNARGRVMIGARPSRSSEAVAEALRAEITTAAPTLPVTAVGTMQRLQMTRGYSGRWLALNGKLAGTGVAVALLLALLGIVGVVHEGLGRRTREIGLRMALGARARAVVGMSARESTTVVLAGVALGLGSLFVLDGLLSRVVFGWEAQRLALGVLHPGVLAVAATAVTLIACATSVIAAGRAAGIDPAVALRSE
jgi:putative ABC transport system permease protein